MKKVALAVVFALMAVPCLFAQNHGEIGVYADYYRPQDTGGLNLFGVGGRIGFNVHTHVALEAEGSYDFERNFTSSPGDLFNTSTTTSRTNLRVTHFLFGPKFQAGGDSPVRAFLVLKGGAARFGVTPGPVTFGTFPTQVENTDTKPVFYPGGGIEFFAGPIGIRGEVGDEIFFDNGAHNALKIMVGPTIRF